MKEIEIKLNVYEVGDILEISEVDVRCRAKTALARGRKAMVIIARPTMGGRYSYDVLTDEMMKVTIKAEELGNERYIGHIDLSELVAIDE